MKKLSQALRLQVLSAYGPLSLKPIDYTLLFDIVVSDASTIAAGV